MWNSGFRAQGAILRSVHRVWLKWFKKDGGCGFKDHFLDPEPSALEDSG